MNTALVWFRRDLRSFDNAALSQALAQFDRVHCAFVFDTEILDALPARRDRRVEFIWHAVAELDRALAELGAGAGVPGAGLIVAHGRADREIPALARELGVQAVLTNRDYEPEALARDARVMQALARDGIAFRAFKDQVVFESDEVLTREGRPFSVFTPYRNAWRRQLDPARLQPFPVASNAARLAPRPLQRDNMPALAALGFEPTDLAALRLPTGMSGGRALVDDFMGRIGRYREARDYPALKGVSYLSTHLRFGTVSVRELFARALAEGSEGAQCWVDELIWREFYQMILWHHPRVVSASFRPEYDRVRWEDDPAGFEAWQEGRTGYPIVDAGMRQLRQSGYMHNRLRMVAASFLTKDLGIDWRLGERHFAALLNDYDLAANNGGWQWAASTGCDAQPYFRIFNPVTQSERFDPKGGFIRRYVPELARVPERYIHAPWKMSAADQAAAGVRIGRDYPAPLVDHGEARQRTLARYAVVKG
ncbi:deoxyribodipyrimidine photo-lyase [Thauera sp. CAU 1555]|uniref:Deoxyribodipyrimidine photo-lyase n=1 Tax=Thauera sedimentorum TaxID=2767595 RepID=A0ABR9BDI1_9RHOO|nr:deoxyribodipyrimidine photo-lyase [Thauera sedimentorum]MBC9073485.1 deoxyribodipyrimidine photo-lyase [Thauera sedimentorum]MBD8504404.1 deoxyribodipyrimidine photo-lyase [Thauera sedimentorum]